MNIMASIDNKIARASLTRFLDCPSMLFGPKTIIIYKTNLISENHEKPQISASLIKYSVISHWICYNDIDLKHIISFFFCIIMLCAKDVYEQQGKKIRRKERKKS